MDQVDFGFVGANKFTIYKSCFQKYLSLNYRLKRPLSEAESKTLVTKTEIVFGFLVEEGNKRGCDVDAILEISDSPGSTCFSVASGMSKKISEYIIGRKIKVNNITTHMKVPDFYYPDLAVPMMKKGINPQVISSIGKKQNG